jgi:hypothetical protein
MEEIICPNPNCGYKGKPKVILTGSSLVSIILLLLGLWPGILYNIFCRKRILVCPKCGIKIREL